MSSRSPGIDRWYRVIGIFLTISPARRSNRRYSSIMKNRDLLHKYLVVPITTHTHVRRKSSGKKKTIEKTGNKGRGHDIPIQDHPASSRSRRSLLLFVVGNIYMAVSMSRHGDSTALLMIPNGFRDALGTNCIDSSRGRASGTNCGRMANFSPTQVICKKTRENISELS